MVNDHLRIERQTLTVCCGRSIEFHRILITWVGKVDKTKKRELPDYAA